MVGWVGVVGWGWGGQGVGGRVGGGGVGRVWVVGSVVVEWVGVWVVGCEVVEEWLVV